MSRKSLNEQVRDLLAIGLVSKHGEKPDRSFNPKPIAPSILPSRGLILKTYNKYRKGYEYTKEVWELRELLLPVVVAYYLNSVHFEKLFRYMTYNSPSCVDMKEYKFWEKREDQFLDGCQGLCTGSDELHPVIQAAIQRLHQAKTDFDILCAIDHVFNILHDDGSIAKYMLTINGKLLTNLDTKKYLAWEAEFNTFIETLKTLRDW